MCTIMSPSMLTLRVVHCDVVPSAMPNSYSTQLLLPAIRSKWSMYISILLLLFIHYSNLKLFTNGLKLALFRMGEPNFKGMKKVLKNTSAARKCA